MTFFNFRFGESTRAFTEHWRLGDAPLRLEFLGEIAEVDPLHASVEHLSVGSDQGQNQMGMDVVAVLVLRGHGQQIPVSVCGVRSAAVVPDDGPDHLRPL